VCVYVCVRALRLMGGACWTTTEKDSHTHTHTHTQTHTHTHLQTLEEAASQQRHDRDDLRHGHGGPHNFPTTGVFQRVAVCCSVLLCVAACCCVLQSD